MSKSLLFEVQLEYVEKYQFINSVVEFFKGYDDNVKIIRMGVSVGLVGLHSLGVLANSVIVFKTNLDNRSKEKIRKFMIQWGTIIFYDE